MIIIRVYGRGNNTHESQGPLLIQILHPSIGIKELSGDSRMIPNKTLLRITTLFFKAISLKGNQSLKVKRNSQEAGTEACPYGLSMVVQERPGYHSIRPAPKEMDLDFKTPDS
jgi:hypothetical protein